MTWSTPHPHALVVDDVSTGSRLVGSTWRRRKPEGDAWDNARIVGIYDNGPDLGLELCVQTVEFTGEPTLTADAESFVAAYTQEAEAADPLAELRERITQLERARA